MAEREIVSVLVVASDESFHDSVREALQCESLHGEAPRIDCATEEDRAAEMLLEAARAQDPYAIAVVDLDDDSDAAALDTARTLLRLDERVLVIVATATAATTDLGTDNNRWVAIQKPFEPSALRQWIRIVSSLRIALEKSLRSKSQLEELVSVRTESLESARAELLAFKEELNVIHSRAEAARNLKEDLLNTVSREIRAPLGGVVGMTSLLMETDLDKRQKEYVDTVVSSSDLLLDRISNVLERVQLEGGGLELEAEEFDLAAAVEEVVGGLMASASEKGIELAMKIGSRTPETYRGDRHRVQRVLTHLVQNAIKFTHNGHVLVTVDLDEKISRERPLILAVEDTGIGMSSEVAASLFDDLVYRDEHDDSEDRPANIGFGVPIAKRLVELMDGRLRVVSQEGLGSVFSVHLSHASAPGAESETRSNPLPIERLRDVDVLVISPRAITRRLLYDQLKEWGMSVGLAMNLEEAYELVQESNEDGDPFRVVIVDQAESTTDGPAFANALQNPDRIGDIPAIVLGDPVATLSAEEIDAVGYAGYLLKPLRAHRLAVFLDHVLGAVEAGEKVVGVTEADLDLEEPKPA